MTRVNPLDSLGKSLLSVQNPVRYLGGEFGQIVKESADLTVALAFPDLYEIAMSNLALKILYDGMNRIPAVRCERVFATAPDFEQLLVSKSVPLYTLESGIPVQECDIVAVSIGYEPGITGLLSILAYSGIALKVEDRGDNDPIVIAGGCGVTNPAPFSDFIDAFFIGEAEAGFFTLIEQLSEARSRGASRDDLLGLIEGHPAVWTIQKDMNRSPQASCAKKAVYGDFGGIQDRQTCFPVPHMRIVQDHGSLEIMRGCPNGCRFCHAGIYYRPQRMKSVRRIIEDVDFLVDRGGYREISLMSLSSGDYTGISDVMNYLTARYSSKHVSFQLPSLKVNSFTLPLLEKMAEVRKSGLTFAVETPVDAWQLAVNKEVYRNKIVDILNEAKKRGWSKAKFYFMVGLPVEKDGKFEENEIIDFLVDIQDRTRIQCNVNVGTFIPKPHTPYQWAPQLSIADADRKLDFIRQSLPRGRFKVNTHRSFSSFLEAVISRGDRRVGALVLEAWKRGCRLDAWEDWARPDIWQSVIQEASWNVEAETIRARQVDESLPWDGVSLGVTKKFLLREKQRSDSQTLTSRCHENCIENCGICGSNTSVIQRDAESELKALTVPPQGTVSSPESWRVLVSFAKTAEASFVPHLGLLEVWNKTFQRSGLPVVYTEGFNPLPRFELGQTLSIGITSDDETASFMLTQDVSATEIMRLLNENLPNNIRVTKVFTYRLSLKIKRESLSRFFWGATYRYTFLHEKELQHIVRSEDFLTFCSDKKVEIVDGPLNNCVDLVVPFSADRPLRELIAHIINKPLYEIVGIHKQKALASHSAINQGVPVSFFDVFSYIAEENQC